MAIGRVAEELKSEEQGSRFSAIVFKFHVYALARVNTLDSDKLAGPILKKKRRNSLAFVNQDQAYGHNKTVGLALLKSILFPFNF
jgi:hypothetical protein